MVKDLGTWPTESVSLCKLSFMSTSHVCTLIRMTAFVLYVFGKELQAQGTLAGVFICWTTLVVPGALPKEAFSRLTFLDRPSQLRMTGVTALAPPLST